MHTALIILNYNNFEDTVNCIESVEKYNSAPIKYIVVDNGSTKEGVSTLLDEYFKRKFVNSYQCFDYERDVAPDCLPYMSFVVSKTNDGYACGNNKGLKYAYADASIDKVMILNNDVLFIQDIIPQLSKFVEEKEDCAIASPLLLKKNQLDIDYNCARLAPNVEQILLPYLLFYQNIFGLITKMRSKTQILRKSPEKAQEICFPIELPSGSCMMMKKGLMESIGGFDPHTFLYYEENILHEKIKRKGLLSFLLPSVRCVHLGASSTKKSVNSFILQTGIKSSRYFLRQYCHLSMTQKIIARIAYSNIGIKIKLMKLLGK